MGRVQKGADLPPYADPGADHTERSGARAELPDADTARATIDV